MKDEIASEAALPPAGAGEAGKAPAAAAAPGARGRRRRRSGTVVVTALLAGFAGAVAVWVLIGLALLVEQGRAVDTALRDTATLAHTLQESLDRRIEGIDARLRFGQTLFARDAAAFSLGAWAGIDPAGRDIVQGLIVTRDGRLRLGVPTPGGMETESVPAPPHLLARPEIRAHFDHPHQDRLVTGTPEPAIGGDRPTIGFSRPLHGPDGRVQAVLVLAVDAAGLMRLHESLFFGPGGAALLNRDGVILAHAPAGFAGFERIVPRVVLEVMVDPDRRQLSARSTILPDANDRFLTLRRLETQPLVVLVARDAQSALAFFLEDRRRLLALGVMISTLIALVVALFEQKRASSRRDRAQLEALVASLSQGIVTADRDGRLGVVNARAAALLGVPSDRVAPGQKLAGLIPPPTQPGEAEETPRARAAAADPGHYELSRADGRVLEIRTEPMPEGGTVRTITDVTARRRARDALAAARDVALAAEAALAAAIDNVPQGIILIGVDRRLRVINRQAAAMLDLPAELARPGTPVAEILEWQVRNGRYAGDPAALADALRNLAEDSVVSSQSERRMPDGRILEQRTVPLPEGGWVRCYTDVTERRRQEHALETAHAATLAAEAALSAAIENVPQGIMLLSAEGRVRVMNRRAAALLDLPAALAQPGVAVAEILALQRARGEFDAAPEIAVQAALPGFASPSGAPPLFEYPRADGVVLEVRTIRTADGGAVRTVTDVTAQRRAEREMRAARDAAEAGARARAEFLAVMSHEIRTPLNAVIGLSGLMEDGPLSPDQAAHARLIREAGDHLLSLVNDILDFSSLESGQLKLEAIAFDPAAEADAVIELLQPQAHAKGLVIRAEIAPGVPERVVGDPGRLRQVLLNLLNNAVKFTEAGSITLGMQVLEAAEERVRLGIAVRDSGIGIPEEAMTRLFSAFQQGDASTSRRYGGTGLGLAISRQLVERMGGSIAVESRPGEGSTFRFDILLRAAPARSQAALPPPEPPQEMPRLRILLAEDNSTNRLVLTHRLQQMGHRTDAVSDGLEALEAVRTRPYDLVIMDMMMPGMDGLEATRAIRALPAPAGQLPIIGLTAAAMPEDEAACIAAGMDGYEKKPIGTERLRAALLAVAAMKEQLRV